MNPTISVIMLAYNCESFKKVIESILNQIFSDFELIICDDGSLIGLVSYQLYLLHENVGVTINE